MEGESLSFSRWKDAKEILRRRNIFPYSEAREYNA
jgi:hypothetical protein